MSSDPTAELPDQSEADQPTDPGPTDDVALSDSERPRTPAGWYPTRMVGSGIGMDPVGQIGREARQTHSPASPQRAMRLDSDGARSVARLY